MSDKPTPPIALQSEHIDEIASALAKAQGQIKGASKDGINPHFKSRYADLFAVWEACREPLSVNGIAVCQQPLVWEGDVYIVTTFAHSSGQWLRGIYPLNPVRNDPQGLGSAVTYARRYTLSAMAGVAPEDDDGEAASGRGTTNGKESTYKRGTDELRVDRETGEVHEGPARDARPLMAGYITTDQQKKFWTKAKKHRWSEGLLKVMLSKNEIASLKDIKATSYDDLYAKLEEGPPKADPENGDVL